ncbi:hypothetical protein F511_20621 [Dorcoceras hygrometricum]|uniref:Uncharacterized protein n=1 Tax=Dorcoceras hygrometricum TaxID=472368 RepID=A0A2Z7B797_9LAMI|nr:hypothetical protein F511_20621 [Dorcoceras hygrometricum]
MKIGEATRRAAALRGGDHHVARASARATPSRASRAMDDLMSRAGHATRARWPSDCAIVSGGWWRCIARAAHGVARGAARVTASLDDGRASCSTTARYAGRRWAKLLDARRRCWSAMVRTGCACSTPLVARACVRRRALPPRFRGGGVAVTGRRSGDVVTAGLNSSRVLVRARPGQPVKFSGLYAMSGPVLIDFEILSFWA